MEALLQLAVQHDGLALRYGAGNAALLNDPELVTAAVQQNGLALQFAAAALQADDAVVALAVAQNPAAKQFAADAWKAKHVPGWAEVHQPTMPDKSDAAAETAAAAVAAAAAQYRLTKQLQPRC